MSTRRAASGSKCQPSITVTGIAASATSGSSARRRDPAAPRARAAAAPRSSSCSTCQRSTPAYSATENSPVVRSSSAAPTRSPSVRPERHQERRLARVEVVRVEQRARRDHAHDLAPDDALGLPGILDLLADRDAVALAHEPGEVAVDGVKRHAAHRNRPAGRVLRSRGQRQVERARRDQRVLEEHLVEVAHAKEHDGVAILPLGVVVLAHRGRERAACEKPSQACRSRERPSDSEQARQDCTAV